MLEALGGAFELITPAFLLFIMFGVLVSTAIAILPGISGVFALAILAAFASLAGAENGLAILIGALAATSTGNTITAVLFGIPGTASGAMLVFDGYPLAKQGQAARAIAAGLTASALGGIVGAAVLAALLPFARTIVLALSSPEYFVLILLALLMMAQVGQGDMLKYLVSGLFGLMVGFIGQEISTSTMRYTFGSLYLWSGIPLVPALIGLFALVEMLKLAQTRGSISEAAGKGPAFRGTWQGVMDTFRRPGTVLKGGLIGSLIGMMPGVGTPAAGFIAYAQAAKSSDDPDSFGKGNIEGVIGPDSATNATDGGSLIPTLVFAIPGSAGMAILLAALVSLGYRPGPQMVEERLDILWLIVLTLVIANFLAVILCLGLSPLLSKLTQVRGSFIIPCIFALGSVGAFIANRALGDLIVMVVFGFVGYALVSFGYSRPLFIIGLVLGPILERHFLLAMRVHGLAFVTRPIVLGLLALGFFVLLGPTIRARLSRSDSQPGPLTDVVGR